MISAKGLSVSFSGKSVFHCLDFSLLDNEFIAVIGPNGSGKSTLGLFLAGVIPEFINAEVSGESSLEKNTGLLMQNPSTQFFALTVKEELNGQLPSGMGLESFWEKNVFELSEGEKQRINLAANLLSNSGTIIFDEPLELLDPMQANIFLKKIGSLKEKKAILWLDKDERFVKNAKKIFLGKQLHDFPFPKKHSIGKELLHADISVKRAGFELSTLKLKVREGEKIALLGMNGSGKTTLLKAVAGLAPFKGVLNMNSGFSFSPQNPDHIFFENSVAAEINDAAKTRFFGLQNSAEKFPERLSKGQKKMLSLASLKQQKLFLLDEPTTWLDAANRAVVYSWINQSKSAFLIATHDKKLLDYCDRALLLEGGELKECSSTTVERFFRAGQ